MTNQQDREARRTTIRAYLNGGVTPEQFDGLREHVERELADADQDREKYRAGLRDADKRLNEMNAELQRYAEGTERPVLWSVYNRMHVRAATAEAEVTRLSRMVDEYSAGARGLSDKLRQAQDTIERVRELHDRLLTSDTFADPDDEITRGAAAKRIATALDGRREPIAAADAQETIHGAGTGAADLAACTVPVSPREGGIARPGHPVYDLLDALTGPAMPHDAAVNLVSTYYKAVTSAPPADPAERPVEVVVRCELTPAQIRAAADELLNDISRKAIKAAEG